MKLIDLTEASYPGNIGAMEVIKFTQRATDEEKKQFDEYLQKASDARLAAKTAKDEDEVLTLKNISSKYTNNAWEMVERKLGVKLYPMPNTGE